MLTALSFLLWTRMCWWTKLSSSCWIWCVERILNYMSSMVRLKAVSPRSPSSIQIPWKWFRWATEFGSTAPLYTVYMLQVLGGMEVGRGKLSSKWEIQPSSFRKVYSQRLSQCSHISLHADWLSKSFDLQEKLMSWDLKALGKKRIWIDVCSLCKTQWLISGLIQISVHPHHKPSTIADFHRTLHWQLCFSIKINVLHKSRIWYYLTIKYCPK